MKISTHLARTAGALSLLAGSAVAMAQPTIDGIKDASYGNPIWVNTIPTGFGNNGDPVAPCIGSQGSIGSFQGCYPANTAGGASTCGNNTTGLALTLNNSNIAGVTSGAATGPELVQTGVEFSIPVSQIGTPGLAQAIGMIAAINGGGHDFLSNQILPGLPSGAGNLGNPTTVNLGTAGQVVTAFVPTVVGTSPIIDGTLDAAIYGAPIALQTNPTGFGDSNSGDPGSANGSELDGLYVVRHDNGTPSDPSDDVLFVCLTGNLESNFNKLEVFFDTIAGAGQGTLFNSNANVDFNGLNRLAGLTFPSGFAADFYITGGCGNSPVTMFPNYATLPTCPPPPPPPTGDVDLSTGSEIDAVYAQVDTANNRLYVFVAGNLETGGGGIDSNAGNKFEFFIDCAAGGQNKMRGDNVDISFGNLNRFGDDGSGNGLQWDDGFAADYWVQYKNLGVIGDVGHVVDCATLRTDGRLLVPFLFGQLDYGAYYGGPKNNAQYNPATFNGNSAAAPGGFIDPNPNTNGDLGSIFTNFAPRLTGASLYASQANPPYTPPFDAPVGATNKITYNMNNGNVGGVSGTSGAGGELVTKGFELSIDLTELGWDGSSPIKLAGFVANNDATFISNQVIGGLPDGSGNLGGNVRGLDFRTIAGNQFVTLYVPCPADFNHDGEINPDDLGDFITCYFTEPPCPGANFNGDGDINPDDLGDFITSYFGSVSTGC